MTGLVHRVVDWNEANVARLTEWWASGLSARQIAEKLGPRVTRNAVIAKVNRLKLTRRDGVTKKLNARLNRPKRTPAPRPQPVRAAPKPGARNAAPATRSAEGRAYAAPESAPPPTPRAPRRRPRSLAWPSPRSPASSPSRSWTWARTPAAGRSTSRAPRSSTTAEPSPPETAPTARGTPG